jgi:spore coat polysaccharide biosynthesis protein SpsF
MRVVAIVQARMGSSRLPAKVLARIAGKTMLARVVGRLLDARSLDAIVIATTTRELDDVIEAEAERLGVGVFRGSETDVLARYHGAARAARAEAIVRITSDCPLIDPNVVDAVVAALGPDIDYASNTRDRTYPRGLDVEAFHRDTLDRMARMATSQAAREHVTAFITEHPELFQIAQVRSHLDASEMRWTVDTPEDLELVRALCAAFDGNPPGVDELIAYLRARPDLAAINAHVLQNPLHVV